MKVFHPGKYHCRNRGITAMYAFLVKLVECGYETEMATNSEN